MLIAGRVFALVSLLIVCGLILVQIERAKRGNRITIRRIAGLEAMDEAIGRATEMGRPVHYTAGVGNLTSRGASVTIATLEYLDYIARTCAKYNTKFINTVAQGDVFTVSYEIVKNAFDTGESQGRFSSDMVRFLTVDQYAYAGAIVGIVNREKVAANIIIGHFANEALFIAEASHAAGAIQIAGTTNEYQLPFLVAACDYTLIGEEIFAGSAYFSQNPTDLGVISGEDYGKALAALLLVVGVVLAATKSPVLLNLMKL